MNTSAISVINLDNATLSGHVERLPTHGRAKGCAYTGCRLPIPAFDAIAPVMNGKMAAPAAPQLAIQPIAPDMSS